MTTKLVKFDSVQGFTGVCEISPIDDFSCELKFGTTGRGKKTRLTVKRNEKEYIKHLTDTGWIDATEEDSEFFIEETDEESAKHDKIRYSGIHRDVQDFLADVFEYADGYIESALKVAIELVSMSDLRRARSIIKELGVIAQTEDITKWSDYEKSKWVNRIFALLPLKNGKQVYEIFENFNLDKMEELMTILLYKVANIRSSSVYKMASQINAMIDPMYEESKFWRETQAWIHKTKPDIMISRLFRFRGVDTKAWEDSLRNAQELEVMRCFHGTRPQALRHIMAQGLRMPVSSGLMFGPGIYNTDHMSKSINYTVATESGMVEGEHPILITEINAARMKEVSTPEQWNLERLEKEGKWSVYYPHITADMNDGRPKSNGNERVIFDPSMVRIIGVAMVGTKSELKKKVWEQKTLAL